MRGCRRALLFLSLDCKNNGKGRPSHDETRRSKMFFSSLCIKQQKRGETKERKNDWKLRTKRRYL